MNQLDFCTRIVWISWVSTWIVWISWFPPELSGPGGFLPVLSESTGFLQEFFGPAGFLPELSELAEFYLNCLNQLGFYLNCLDQLGLYLNCLDQLGSYLNYLDQLFYEGLVVVARGSGRTTVARVTPFTAASVTFILSILSSIRVTSRIFLLLWTTCAYLCWTKGILYITCLICIFCKDLCNSFFHKVIAYWSMIWIKHIPLK